MLSLHMQGFWILAEVWRGWRPSFSAHVRRDTPAQVGEGNSSWTGSLVILSSLVWVDRDSGSDLPQNLCLLEDAHIETSRPKRERGGQTSDSTADDCNAKRTRHFTKTFAVNRKDRPYEPGSCGYPRILG